MGNNYPYLLLTEAARSLGYILHYNPYIQIHFLGVGNLGVGTTKKGTHGPQILCF